MSGTYVGVGNSVHKKSKPETAKTAETAETATPKDESNKKAKLEDE